MTTDDATTQAWARENKAAWELEPLVEMHKGERVQVGFELDLYARLPKGMEPGEEPQGVAEALWDRLHELAESLLPLAGSGSRIEIDPFEAAGRLRPETQFAAEVLLQARLLHGSDYFKPVAEQDRELLKPLEERLLALGLRARSW